MLSKRNCHDALPPGADHVPRALPDCRFAARRAAGRGNHARHGPAQHGDARRFRDHGRPAAERAPLLRAREPEAGEARRAAAGRQSGIDPRRRRPARAGAFRRAHGVQRHAELSAAGRNRVHAVARDEVRRARERVHGVRRDGLPAPGADRSARRDGPGAARARRLGAQRDVRSARDREGTRRDHGGMAAAPRRGRAADRSGVPDHAPGLALRGAAADRHDRRHPELQARAAEAVLHRLVPARPDGGGGGRRLRPGGGRGARQVSLHPAHESGIAAAAPDLRRARPRRNGVRDHVGPGNDRRERRDRHTPAGTRTGYGRRVPGEDCRTGSFRGCCRRGSPISASSRTRRS